MPLEVTLASQKFGWRKVSRNHQGMVNHVSLVDGDSQIAHDCTCRGWLSKETMASTSTTVWEKAAPPALTLKPEDCFFYISLVTSQLLCHHSSSEAGSPNVPGRGTSWDSNSPPCLSVTISAYFTARSYGVFSLQH